MLINRNNYESFFLLYVDGELNAPERKAVEDFAAANADLQQELEMLMETILPADDVIFEGKESLFKTLQVDKDFQQRLLLKIDDELPAAELATVNAVLSVDPNAKAELQLLQRTKLDAADRVIFADKHLLYRKEKDNVVIGRFVRWAAAAIFIGFGLFFGITIFNKKTVSNGDVATTKPANGTGKGPQSTKDAQSGQPAQPSETIAATDPKIKVKVSPAGTDPNSQTGDASVAGTLPEKKQKNNSTQKLNNNGTTTDLKDLQQQQAPKDQNIAVLQPKNQNNLPVPVVSDNTQRLAVNTVPKKTDLLVTDNNVIPLENTYAQAASFTADKSENKILYMDEDDVKRSKTGGFFRKVKRLVERTAKIKTGGALRIAGFEIAAK